MTRKFKTLEGVIHSYNGSSTVYPREKTSVLNIEGILTSPVLLGHIAEYEQFAVSYIKVKAKYVGGRVDSFIVSIDPVDISKGDRKKYINPL